MVTTKKSCRWFEKVSGVQEELKAVTGVLLQAHVTFVEAAAKG